MPANGAQSDRLNTLPLYPPSPSKSSGQIATPNVEVLRLHPETLTANVEVLSLHLQILTTDQAIQMERKGWPHTCFTTGRISEPVFDSVAESVIDFVSE